MKGGKALVVLLAILMSMPATARELWEKDGFSLTTCGWVDQEVFPDWLGVKVRMSVPPDGYVAFQQMGSLEFHLPCKGWVLDLGIIVADGCVPDPQTGWDTLGYHWLNITEDSGCEEFGGDVLMVIRIPKMFPTKECRPDSVHWAGGYYDVED